MLKEEQKVILYSINNDAQNDINCFIDYKAEPWKTNAEGNLERNITNTIPLNLPMGWIFILFFPFFFLLFFLFLFFVLGKNSTDVYETQTYLKKEDYVYIFYSDFEISINET